MATGFKSYGKQSTDNPNQPDQGPINTPHIDGAPLTPSEQASMDQIEAGYGSTEAAEPEQLPQDYSDAEEVDDAPQQSAPNTQPTNNPPTDHQPQSHPDTPPEENQKNPHPQDESAQKEPPEEEKKSMAKQAAKDTTRRTALYAGAEIGKEIAIDATKEVAHGAARNAARHESKKVTGEMVKKAAKSGAKKAAKKTAKRAAFKWIFGFALPTGTIAFFIIGVLFFLMLFKSVHIRNIYIDYEFAKFNRGFSRRLDKAVKEAKATGNADTEVPATASPEDQLKGANEEELNKIKNDPSAIEKDAKAGTDFEQTKAGVTGEGDLEFGIKRSVPVEEETDPAKARAAVKADIESDIRGPKGDIPKAPGILDDAVKEAQAQDAAGASPAEIKASALENVAKAIQGPLPALTKGLFIATIGCIARDIYITSADLFSQIKLAALARTAASVFKHADCRRETDNLCGLTSEAAVSQMFDSATESFINTAGYQRATSQPVTYAKTSRDLDPAMEPINRGTGIFGELMSMVDSMARFPGLGDVCALVLEPTFQIVSTIVIVGAQAFLAATGVVDFGLSDVLLAATITALQIIGTKAGTALAVDAVLHYAGLIFRGPYTPTQMGNMMDAGTKVLSSDACMRSGCHQLTPTQNQQLTDSIHADQIDYARRQGIAYRLFSPKNPTSALGMLADRVPTHVGSAVTLVQTAIINSAVPSRWFAMLNQLATANPATAFAATAEYQTYGLPDWGVTDAETDRYGVIENSRWVTANVNAETKTKFELCFSTPMNKMLTEPGLTDLAYCSAENDEAMNRYRIYKMDQRASHALVVLHNKQAK